MGEEIVHVGCPCCKNKRLFDVDTKTEGMISIKCPVCKSVVTIVLHNKKIRTERIGAC